MPERSINGGTIVYEVMGSGPPIVLTPGGSFGLDVPGLRPLADRLAERMQVVLWDRPNTGRSDFKFTGASESLMCADDLAELVRALDLGPVVLAGGSAGSRVSILTAIHHPDVVSKLAVWMMSGGTFGTLFLAMNYLLPHIAAAWASGMEAVAELTDIRARIDAEPRLKQQILDLDRDEFLGRLNRWLEAYVPRPENVLPGVPAVDVARVSVPTVIFRNGDGDPYHPAEVSFAVHEAIASSDLVEPPWGRDSWFQTKQRQLAGQGNLFDDWVLLAEPILEFAAPDR
jgi:2-hydroxy-6-oxonona-2,4-dienedioate hydrolase